MVQTAIAPDPPDRSAEPSRADQRKREILAAAGRVFRRRGLHAAGMREIAAESGMHAGNLYYYFENKQQLLAFCQEDTLTELLGMARRVTAGDRPAGDQLRELIGGHVEVLNERSRGSLAHLEVEALDQPWRARVQRDRDAYERIYRDLIAAGIASGDFRPVDPAVAALAVLGALNWTVKWFRPEGSRSAAEIGGQFADLLVAGLRSGGEEIR